ncbi:AgseGVORF137-like protein [Hyphantria cunea granulovirus]|uniref:AgseGVORF137-like protein n=1 Tax=Hyphantria cunea granulovirus TaxID=307448 RepID=A0AAF1D2B8_9BBAC|nr:AgseGVORF137-like protein [Hyphantria cunea granulovirus]QBQ01676.1 AgseGVORF137-like protein [Hyphantria cunea granulovirus]
MSRRESIKSYRSSGSGEGDKYKLSKMFGRRSRSPRSRSQSPGIESKTRRTTTSGESNGSGVYPNINAELPDTSGVQPIASASTASVAITPSTQIVSPAPVTSAKTLLKPEEPNLKTLTMLYNKPVNLNSVFIAKVPTLSDNPARSVQILNDYFDRILQISGGVSSFLRLTPGDTAVGYAPYVYLLYNKGMRGSTLKQSRNVIRQMYIQWADQVPRLLHAVIQVNGADPVKEVMTVVNQSVFRFVAFALSAGEVNVSKIFSNNTFPNSIVDANLNFTVLNQHNSITAAFNYQFSLVANTGRLIKRGDTREIITAQFPLSKYKLRPVVLEIYKI